MIVADTSALCAVVLGEADAERYARALEDAGDVRISAATWIEASVVVLARQGDDALRDLRLLVETVNARIESVTTAHADIAVQAWRRFGKGRHSAGLNYGDCFSYALAESLGCPLLFKGDDFAQTDVRAAT